VIDKQKKEIIELQSLKSKLGEEIADFKDQTNKMKMHLDPSTLTIGDIQKKLMKEDAARFRQVMDDLSFEGKDPKWHDLDIIDMFEQIKAIEPGKKGDKKLQLEMRDQLKREKADLV
jgi:hypothetical protein